MNSPNTTRFCFTLLIAASLTLACAQRQPYTTKHDKTAKGAGIGAAVGAAVGLATGEREADEILARAAIGAVGGAGIGAYMDHQEEKIARIPGTSVERVGEMLLVRFDSDVLFDIDSATVRSAGHDSLQQVAAVLNEYNKTAVIVQGHTDDTGSEVHNQELAERRAGAVRNYLVAQGVAGQRIEAMGFGEGDPIASNATAAGRQLNRRVEILLKAKA